VVEGGGTAEGEKRERSEARGKEREGEGRKGNRRWEAEEGEGMRVTILHNTYLAKSCYSH